MWLGVPWAWFSFYSDLCLNPGMPKILTRFVFALFICGAVYVFLFPDSIPASARLRGIYHLLGPDNFKIYVRVLIGCGLLFLIWAGRSEARVSYRIDRLDRRNSMQEPEKIVEPGLRPDSD